MTTFALVIYVALCLSTATLLHAQEFPELQTARAAYQRAIERGESAETARECYLSGLVQLRRRLVEASRAPGEHPDLEQGWMAVDAEMRGHLLPENVDAKVLSRRLVGRWRSPRHDYLYRRDGTWTMTPAYQQGIQSTHGRWRLEGNRWLKAYGDTPMDASTEVHSYTLILLTDRDWVSTDGQYVFYETRLRK